MKRDIERTRVQRRVLDVDSGAIGTSAAGRGAVAGDDDAGEGINALHRQEAQHINAGVPQVAVDLNLLVGLAAKDIPDRGFIALCGVYVVVEFLRNAGVGRTIFAAPAAGGNAQAQCADQGRLKYLMQFHSRSRSL